MPTINKFGSRLTPDLVTLDKQPSRTSVVSTRPAIQADYWARNGLHPDARLANMLNEHANQASLYRPKQYFNYMGRLDGVGGAVQVRSGQLATRARWRFAFRTGAFAHGLGAIVAMIEPDNGPDQNSYATLEITNGAGAVVATQTFEYGVRGIDFLSEPGWRHMKQIMGLLDGIPADTELYGTFYDLNYGRLVSACVFELPTLSENGGYLAGNITTHSAILDTHRQYAAEVSNAVLQKGAAHIFNWTVDNGASPVTNSTSTPKNIIDTSITAVAAASPGWTLDLRNRGRLSTPDVPVVMNVYASVSAQNFLTDAGIMLVDSSGTAVMSITGSGASAWSTTPAWYTVTGTLPATVEKYDLMLYSNDLAGFDVYAVSLYQYG
jgi:hypothetical protein